MSVLGHFEYTEQGQIAPISDLVVVRQITNPRAIFTTERYMFIKFSDESFIETEKKLIQKFISNLKTKQNGNKS